MQDFAQSVDFAIEILERAALERHIKNIDSLERKSTLDKIWKDLDATSMKMAKGTSLMGMSISARFTAAWESSPVSVTVGEELLAKRTHRDGSRVVLLDDPTTPLQTS